MGFGQDFLKGFFGGQGLRDYRHASRVFTTNQYELKPRYKYLFHVVFTINVEEIPYLKGAFPTEELYQLSLLVKNVDLPKYSVDTETLNQYNRKRVVQTRINYQPVNVTFHDDGGDNARRMWYYYFSYYYKDAIQQYGNNPVTNGSIGPNQNRQVGFNYNARDIYDRELQVKDWGYVGESTSDGTSATSGKPPFFRDIRIFGFDQRKFAEYVLINPVITAWNHDRYDYAEGAGTMEHSMTVAYETVKYFEGGLGETPDANVPGFADPSHYDTTLSPIARPGSNRTVFGQGGLLDAGLGIIGDLQSQSVDGLIGAVQKAGTAYETFKGKDLQSTARTEAVRIGTEELLGGAQNATRQVMNRNTSTYFPT